MAQAFKETEIPEFKASLVCMAVVPARLGAGNRVSPVSCWEPTLSRKRLSALQPFLATYLRVVLFHPDERLAFPSMMFLQEAHHG